MPDRVIQHDAVSFHFCNRVEIAVDPVAVDIRCGPCAGFHLSYESARYQRSLIPFRYDRPHGLGVQNGHGNPVIAVYEKVRDA